MKWGSAADNYKIKENKAKCYLVDIGGTTLYSWDGWFDNWNGSVSGNAYYNMAVGRKVVHACDYSWLYSLADPHTVNTTSTAYRVGRTDVAISYMRTENLLLADGAVIYYNVTSANEGQAYQINVKWRDLATYTVTDSFAYITTPDFAADRAIAWDGTDLFYLDSNNKMRQFSGFSSTIADSFTITAPSGVSGLLVRSLHVMPDGNFLCYCSRTGASPGYGWMIIENFADNVIDYDFTITQYVNNPVLLASTKDMFRWSPELFKKSWDGWKNWSDQTDATVSTKNMMFICDGLFYDHFQFFDADSPGSYPFPIFKDSPDFIKRDTSKQTSTVYGLAWYDNSIHYATSTATVYKFDGTISDKVSVAACGTVLFRYLDIDSSGNIYFVTDHYEGGQYNVNAHKYSYSGTLVSSFNTAYADNSNGQNCTCAWDGSNLLTLFSAVNKAHKYSGFTNTVTDSFVPTATSTEYDMTWDGTNLWITGRETTSLAYGVFKMDGFSSTLLSSYVMVKQDDGVEGICYAANTKFGNISGDVVVSPVYKGYGGSYIDFSFNDYETPSGDTGSVWFRCSKTPFGQFDALPAWEKYSPDAFDGQEVYRDTAYHQFRLEESSSSSSRSSSSSSRSSSSSSSSAWDHNVLLIPSNTTNGDTVITDSSPHSHTVTKDGDPAHSTVTYQTPTSSIRLDGDDSLNLGYGGEYHLQNYDFWIDISIRLDSISGTQYIISKWGSEPSSQAWRLLVDATGAVRFRASSSDTINPSDIILNGTSSLQANTWYRILVIRTLGSCYLYVNNSLEATDYSTDQMVPGLLIPVIIGAQYGTPLSNYMTGYVDEIEVTIGESFSSSSSSSSSSALP
jgi:hypothetical protein